MPQAIPAAIALASAASAAAGSAGVGVLGATFTVLGTKVTVCESCSTASRSNLQIRGLGRSLINPPELDEATDHEVSRLVDLIHSDPAAFHAELASTQASNRRQIEHVDRQLPNGLRASWKAEGSCLTGTINDGDIVLTAPGSGARRGDVIFVVSDGDPLPRGKVLLGRMAEGPLTRELFTPGHGELLALWQWEPAHLLLVPARDVLELRKIAGVWRDGCVVPVNRHQTMREHVQHIDGLETFRDSIEQEIIFERKAA